jgi:hypothetical protein
MKQKTRTFIIISLCLAPISAFGECEVRLPQTTAVPLESTPGYAWFGSDALAVRLPTSGKWRGKGPGQSYGNKVWFWRRGFDARAEIPPALTIAGVKVDSGEEPQRMEARAAGGAMGGESDPHTMVVGMNFPSAGCWALTATYVRLGISEKLTFTVEVEVQPLATGRIVK